MSSPSSGTAQTPKGAPHVHRGIEQEARPVASLPKNGRMTPRAAVSPLTRRQKKSKVAADLLETDRGTRAQSIRFGDMIGKGAFGCVSAGTDSRSGSEIAIKRQTDIFGDHNPWRWRAAIREAQILRRVHHPNIIQVLDMFCTTAGSCVDLWIVMPRISGTLCELIQHFVVQADTPDEKLRWEQRLVMFLIASGVDYLHSLGIAHRDLKPLNILFNGEPFHVLITDFGQSRACAWDEGCPRSSRGVCTAGYAAPETIPLRGNEGSLMESSMQQADIFSLGCIFYEVLTGKKMFTGCDLESVLGVVGPIEDSAFNIYAAGRSDGEVFQLRQINENVKQGKPLLMEMLNGVPLCSDVVNLIQSMVQTDPRKRPTSVQVKNTLFAEDFPIDYVASSIPPSRFQTVRREEIATVETARTFLSSLFDDSSAF